MARIPRENAAPRECALTIARQPESGSHDVFYLRTEAGRQAGRQVGRQDGQAAWGSDSLAPTVYIPGVSSVRSLLNTINCPS